jgi:diaminohydroxyphosphoribosylaminopyrimidine deaminase/5-amino-6-(5-phosphoribosylamino)uracil reductase
MAGSPRRPEIPWISNAESRELVHRWRADCDAVAVGIGTALADDPLLTARLEGEARQPARVVFDSGPSCRSTPPLSARSTRRP